jgi:hypothetical protein
MIQVEEEGGKSPNELCGHLKDAVNYPASADWTPSIPAEL